MPSLQFKALSVELTRNETTRRLSAYIKQPDAAGEVKGKNLLTGRGLLRTSSAKRDIVNAHRDIAEHITFDFTGSPDYQRPAKK